jgi:O-antigen polysaccharide polymerase Wzy
MNQRSGSPDRVVLSAALNPVSMLAPPAVGTALMWITSTNPVAPTATVCAYLIFQLAWGSYLFWKHQNQTGLPVFALIASVYSIYFSLALFWGERVLFLARIIPVSEEFVTQTMEMAVLGVVCLLIGMRIPLRMDASRRLPDIDEHASSSWAYLRIVLVVTTLIGSYAPVVYLFGASGRQVMIVLLSMIPTVAFVLLLRRCWMGAASPVDRPLLIAAGVARLVSALASGWLGPLVGLGLTLAALFVLIRRRIPWMPIILTIAAILFLQVGKEEFRSTYWGSGAQSTDDNSSGAFERAQFWLNTSASQWTDSLQAGGPAKPSQLAGRTIERASLLTEVAHVLELTPSQVPFQEGQTYSYLGVTLIPRFLWPDKPSVSEANRFYQLAYGLSDSRSVETTSIAVGSMAEAYINFGWLGVIVIMCGIGAILRIYECVFITNQSNTLLVAIGVALLPQFFAIEGQLGQYIGGLLQQAFLAFLVFLPITGRKARVVLPSNQFRASAVRVRG